MSDTAMPIPPPTFEFLVLSIKMQAEMQLGLMNFGGEEEPQADLIGARHAIDMLGMLLDKTKGNLTTEEHRLIENSLTELRFRFVQVTQAPPPKPAEAVKEPVEAASSADNAESSKEKVSSDAAPKKTDEKEEESAKSSSGIRVTDRRSGKSSAEE